MKLKFQIVFFSLLLGLAGCFGDDETEQAVSEEPGQPDFSQVDADRRLETVINNLEEEDENGNVDAGSDADADAEEEDIPLDDEYLEEQEALAEESEEPEDFVEDDENEPLSEDE